MRRPGYILCLLAVLAGLNVTGQTRSAMRESFLSAEVDILYEDYQEALPKFINLLQTFPENFNFCYRVGQCYLNTPGEKAKSIPYLETAVANINPAYRPGRFREKGAPYDALYFLANAYRINGDLDKALKTYDLFLEDVDSEVYDTTLIRFQMQSCHTARSMIENPADLDKRNLGGTINERFSEFNPVVSADGSMIVFTRKLQFYDAVFYSKRVNGEWTAPVNITPELGVDQDYFSSSLTEDGKTLLLYRTDNYEGNIYLSRFDGERWSNVEKLNDRINTKYWESHAALSGDGRRLFFTSNRRESSGGLDIFVSELDSAGNWGTPANAGPVINTIYDEETPFLANNDSSLFFSSRGHLNMGGYDIFRSDLDEYGNWGPPVNLGYPVNTTDDDLFFTPVGNGSSGYTAGFDPGGYEKMDILFYEIFSDSNPRTLQVFEGITRADSLKPDPAESVLIAAPDAAGSLIVKSAADSLSAESAADSLSAESAAADTVSPDDSLRLSRESVRLPATGDKITGELKPVDQPGTFIQAAERQDAVGQDPVGQDAEKQITEIQVAEPPVIKPQKADTVSLTDGETDPDAVGSAGEPTGSRNVCLLWWLALLLLLVILYITRRSWSGKK